MTDTCYHHLAHDVVVFARVAMITIWWHLAWFIMMLKVLLFLALLDRAQAADATNIGEYYTALH